LKNENTNRKICTGVNCEKSAVRPPIRPGNSTSSLVLACFRVDERTLRLLLLVLLLLLLLLLLLRALLLVEREEPDRFRGLDTPPVEPREVTLVRLSDVGEEESVARRDEEDEEDEEMVARRCDAEADADGESTAGVGVAMTGTSIG
jgi:hypothetical protein